MQSNKLTMMFVAALSLGVSVTTYAKKPEDVDVVAACKAECPEAKTNAEAHECAERKGKIRPSFKKTNCWTINEEYEVLIQAPAKK